MKEGSSLASSGSWLLHHIGASREIFSRRQFVFARLSMYESTHVLPSLCDRCRSKNLGWSCEVRTPNFIILHLARQLTMRMDDPFVIELVQTNDRVERVLWLGRSWFGSKESMSGGQGDSREARGEEKEDEDEWEYESSEGGSVHSIPRRVSY
ncbi:hypothetical protein FA13DRAFT_814765 [Coprinellus micaceus]|uniref:Uncharacterized protein n=1 Tax=Coprinellus micaceus TaxID=71717 RepID=A0A4Y7T3E3_COPMI|nr:hypothetical protein FA13DRAFT_814765 [Coprinellus micaceus]